MKRLAALAWCNAATIFLGDEELLLLKWRCQSQSTPASQSVRLAGARKEATMEIRWQMNVLGAVLSFGFVTAIILGMI